MPHRSPPFLLRPALALFCGLSTALLLPAPAANASEFPPPPLMLAKSWQSSFELADFLVSEKLDGVRAYWDGEKLLSRGGERIHAPAWFTAGWPATPMDGELWLGRNQFSQTVSIVRRQTPDDAAWRAMRYMLFDLPAQPGPFTERLGTLQKLAASLKQDWLRPVEQRRVANQAELQAWLERVIAAGGEGLMLHRAAAPYRGERSDDLLKFKPYEDAEARVIAYLPGQGKHAGRLGALLVETRTGQHFSLGSGLSDHDREHPPALGSWVTYRFNGHNQESGLPRFARFLRRREDAGL
jgi:DNA ligase-1